MLAAHFEETHRETDHRPGEAISADCLDAGVPAVAPRELDGLFVGPPHVDGLPELLHSHPTSTPDVLRRRAMDGDIENGPLVMTPTTAASFRAVHRKASCDHS
jgi:hypothetical protein